MPINAKDVVAETIDGKYRFVPDDPDDEEGPGTVFNASGRPVWTDIDRYDVDERLAATIGDIHATSRSETIEYEAREYVEAIEGSGELPSQDGFRAWVDLSVYDDMGFEDFTLTTFDAKGKKKTVEHLNSQLTPAHFGR